MTVQTGAKLRVQSSATDTAIRGNVKGDGCDHIVLDNQGAISSRIVIGGDLSITHCTDVSLQGCVGDSSMDPPTPILIGGNFKCSNNYQGGCGLGACAIGGNVECSGNAHECFLSFATIAGTATLNNNLGGISVFSSAIAGDLKCNGNGAPTSGGGNTVAGIKSGQCSGF